MTTRTIPKPAHRHDLLCWLIGWCPQTKKKTPQKVHTSGRKR